MYKRSFGSFLAATSAVISSLSVTPAMNFVTRPPGPGVKNIGPSKTRYVYRQDREVTDTPSRQRDRQARRRALKDQLSARKKELRREAGRALLARQSEREKQRSYKGLSVAAVLMARRCGHRTRQRDDVDGLLVRLH